MCPHAKKQKCGCEKPYLVCLHPDTHLVKCWDEEKCPLKASVVKDGQCAVEEQRSDCRASKGAFVEELDLFAEAEAPKDDLTYEMFA